MQAILVMFRSDGERRSFSITRDVTVIGRKEDCDLRIPLGDVSRKHCRLILEDDTLRLEDLGSSNGTYHNGVRVEKESLLQPGDSIQVGPVVFVLQVDGVPADEELYPLTAGAGGATEQGGEAGQEGTGHGMDGLGLSEPAEGTYAAADDLEPLPLHDPDENRIDLLDLNDSDTGNGSIPLEDEDSQPRQRPH